MEKDRASFSRGVFTVRMYASRGYFSTGRRARVDRIAWITAYFMAVVTRDFSLRDVDARVMGEFLFPQHRADFLWRCTYDRIMRISYSMLSWRIYENFSILRQSWEIFRFHDDRIMGFPTSILVDAYSRIARASFLAPWRLTWTYASCRFSSTCGVCMIFSILG